MPNDKFQNSNKGQVTDLNFWVLGIGISFGIWISRFEIRS
jgi:hypothetical protein